MINEKIFIDNIALNKRLLFYFAELMEKLLFVYDYKKNDLTFIQNSLMHNGFYNSVKNVDYKHDNISMLKKLIISKFLSGKLKEMIYYKNIIRVILRFMPK